MEGYMDHHQWLINANLMTDEQKDNVAMAGFCLVEDTLDVGTSIDFNNKEVNYRLLLPSKLYNNLMLLERFEKGENLGFFDSLKLKKFIKAKKKTDESGMGYDLQRIGDGFIKGYLNKEWNVSIEIYKQKEKGDEEEDIWLHNEKDQPSN